MYNKNLYYELEELYEGPWNEILNVKYKFLKLPYNKNFIIPVYIIKYKTGRAVSTINMKTGKVIAKSEQKIRYAYFIRYDFLFVPNDKYIYFDRCSSFPKLTKIEYVPYIGYITDDVDSEPIYTNRDIKKLCKHLEDLSYFDYSIERLYKEYFEHQTLLFDTNIDKSYGQYKSTLIDKLLNFFYYEPNM